MNKLLGIRREVIANLREVQGDIGDTEGLKEEITRLENERNVAAELVQQLPAEWKFRFECAEALLGHNSWQVFSCLYIFS